MRAIARSWSPGSPRRFKASASSCCTPGEVATDSGASWASATTRSQLDKSRYFRSRLRYSTGSASDALRTSFSLFWRSPIA